MTTRDAVRFSVGLALLGTTLSCGDTQADASDDAPDVPAPAPAAATVPAPTGPVDPELAATGEALFQQKGCLGCHTVGGGRLTGPDLAGVTERREFSWFVAMVTNPDSMLREDSVARGLFAEYMTPMLSVGATAEEARAIYEFLRTDSN